MSSDPMSQQANNKKEEEQFPIKLHRILEEAEVNGFSDCISWMPDGTSFKIFDKTRLESEVMPQYFESCQFKSFQRSLNMWGFVADNKKSDTTTGGGRRHHPLFVKGRPELCCAMRRVRVKKPGARGKKAIEAEKLTTPPDSPTRTLRQHEDEHASTVNSGFLAPCLQGSRYDHALQNVTTDNCTGLIQQLCQGQSSSNALLHALLATRLQQQGRDQDRSIMLAMQPHSSHPAEIPATDFANRSLLVSTLSKLLSTATTTTNHTPPLQHGVMPSIIGQALTTPAVARPPPVVIHRGSFSQENVVDEAALRQAAAIAALAAVGWNSPPPPSKNPESYFMMDPQQYCEKLLTMNMLLQHQQQQQSSTYSSSSVLADAIRKNLVQGTGGEGYGGGGTRSRSTSTTSTSSSPRQNTNMTNGGLESPHPQVSLSSSTIQNPTMNTLDLASSLLLQHYSLASSIGPS